eukprot:UN20983
MDRQGPLSEVFSCSLELFCFYFLVTFSRNFHSILETYDFQKKLVFPNQIKIDSFFVSCLFL